MWLKGSDVAASFYEISPDRVTCLAGTWFTTQRMVWGPVDVDYKQRLRSDLNIPDFVFTFYSQYLIFYRCYLNAPAFLSYGRQRPPAALSEARSHWWRKYWASSLGPNNMGPGKGLGLRQTRVVTFKFSFWILKIWTERKIEKLKCKFDEKSKTKYEK